MKYLSFLVLVLALLVCTIMGCAAAAVHPTPAGVSSITSTPASLTHVATGLDVIILAAVVAVGAGIGLFFALPASHNISIPLAAIGGAIEASALFARVSLWFVPWAAGGLGILAVGFFVYEIYRNRSVLEGKGGSLSVLP